jgi:hypothetical protein
VIETNERVKRERVREGPKREKSGMGKRDEAAPSASHNGLPVFLCC